MVLWVNAGGFSSSHDSSLYPPGPPMADAPKTTSFCARKLPFSPNTCSLGTKGSCSAWLGADTEEILSEDVAQIVTQPKVNMIFEPKRPRLASRRTSPMEPNGCGTIGLINIRMLFLIQTNPRKELDDYEANAFLMLPRSRSRL